MTPIASPCINVCVLDSRTDLCIGCGRRRAEIAGWRGYDDAERDRVMAELPERLRLMTSRAVRGRAKREVSPTDQTG